jgi:hypothetical protein
MKIEEVLKKSEATLLELPHVTSLGLGERRGQPAVIIFLDRPPAELPAQERSSFPETLGGFPVELRQALRVGQ